MTTRAPKAIQEPPSDWTPTQSVPDPIINNPYKEPEHYWLYKGGVPGKTPGRRPARYFYQSKRVGSASAEMELFKEENEEDLPLVNALRADVKRWRESGYRGASSVTRELLAWWSRPDRPRRLFYCQMEAVETQIYLLELAIPERLSATGYKTFELDADNIQRLLKGEKPTFESIAGDFWPKLVDAPWDGSQLPLRRLACKMATGSGKTIVMAMLIAWAFCNRARNPQSTQFPNGVLVCAPNLTVRKRLQVLCPEDKDNYYDAFDLVPPKYRECLNGGKVLVTNWHVFAPKSEHVEGGKSYAVVNKGAETNDAFVRNRLGELVQRLPILVMNDEGHHCWRSKQLSTEEERAVMQGMTAEQKAALKEEEDEARVWLAGLDRINNCGLAGKDGEGKLNRAILACVDLSATPFFLGASGHPEGSPFPWIVSEFGLIDAIESGITKVPRLPVEDSEGNTDDAGRPDPKYFRLWRNIVENDLKPGDFIRRGQPNPESIYKYAQGALATLAAQWKIQFEGYRQASAGKPFIPPVMIVVCDNTNIANIFFREISGESDVEMINESGETVTAKKYSESSIMPELANTPNVQHTIRIDSKLLAKIETEEGESKDEAALRLREIIDTVGKRGGAGEHVRCVVSVSMLTEGWDANNVTHVLGVRAFGSQLLCEQVVGRGLRRMSYTPDPETGLLHPEYVDVYGIPFSLIPFKGKPKEKDGPDPVYHAIFAMEERKAFELRMPNVESYVYALREGGIWCDVSKLEGFIVNEEPVTVYLAPTRGYQDEAEVRKDSGDFIPQTRQEYYKAVRPQQVIFRLAEFILADLLHGVEAAESERVKFKFLARHQLFPEIVKIVRDYVEQKVTFAPGVDIRELGLKVYADKLRERIRDEILPRAASSDTKLLPVLNSFQPFTSTANVNYQTTRPVVDLVKSHLNRAVTRSSWESRAIGVLELLDCVECYTPNDRQIGLIVPYDYDGHRHNYEPDFIIRLHNKKTLMLEIKGEGGVIHDPNLVTAKSAAAKKWVAAVNNLGRWGTWAFDICTDLSKLREIVESHADVEASARPFRFVDVSTAKPWRDCIPLTTLQAAAGKFSEEQAGFDEMGEWAESWIAWDGAPAFEKGMFVAKVLGTSMEPGIPDGAYCVFRQPRPGSRQGRTVLVWHSGVSDPHTGGQYTVKVYESEKRSGEKGEWSHTQITLRPTNPTHQPIILEPTDEGEVRVVAEFVQVLGSR